MKEGNDLSLDASIAELRARLEAVERDSRFSISLLRAELSALERQVATAAAPRVAPAFQPTAPPPPLPAAAEEPPPVPEMHWLPPKMVPAVVSPSVAAPPSPAPPVEASQGFEQQLGKVWLVRIGIVLLVTGLVLLGNYAYQNWVRDLPNGMRLAALFACAGALIETGRRLTARPALRNFGEVVLGGGLAFGYYCTYAAHHVERLRVVENPVVAAVLLLLAAAAIGAVSWLRQARTTAVMAFLLASYSTMLQPIGWLSSVSNLFLAAGGVVMMLRPGWTGPGVAALLGTYGAFFGWQVLGAAQGRLDDPAVLWFLPTVWAVFSMPGVLGRFDRSLDGRARASFTAANNVLFFLLFSRIWIQQNGESNYWQVPAVLGLVLLGAGVIGRREERAAGGVNLAHGLAGLTLALVLKLEGYHLALALAVQSVVLAWAFSRFRGRSEGAFAFLAGIMACSLAMGAAELASGGNVPVWSAGLTALLVAAASVVMGLVLVDPAGETVSGDDLPSHQTTTTGTLATASRTAAAGMFLLASLAGVVGWCARLQGEWRLPVAAAVATALGAGFVFLDRDRRFREVPVGAWIFLAAAALFLTSATDPPAIAAAALLVLGGAWIWHQATAPPAELSLQQLISAMAWSHSAFLPVVVMVWIAWSDWTPAATAVALTVAALAVAAAGLALRCHRLLSPGALLAFAAAVFCQSRDVEGFWPAFAVALLAWAGAWLLHLPWALSRHDPSAGVAEKILRLSAFMAFCFGIARFSPNHWGDWLAGSAFLLAIGARFAKWRVPLEFLAFLLVAGLWLVWETVTTPWGMAPGLSSWRGWAVVLALLALPLMGNRGKDVHGRWGAAGVALGAALACIAAAVWTTQMLVWRHDWNAAAVLWSVLGFLLVTAGLWLRLVVFRQAGFLLLAMAIVKIFVSDVWDFTAFMRVASFIVLGTALTLLGLFYNRFVPAMKRLLDEDKTPDDLP